MAMEPDEARSARPAHILGEDLSTLSIEELDARIAMLKAEIARIEAAAAKKSSHKEAASAFFRT